MSKIRFTLSAIGLMMLILAAASSAQAQATRTWVSGVGDDVNPCSRTAPCKTFAGAISKTAAGGEIDCLDPGGFGAVTITKSITIDGTHGAGFGSILASGTTGVNVNDSATATPNTITVRLRSLSINGTGTTLGTNGINFTSGATVHIEDCRIMNFSQNGIRVATPQPARLIVQDTTITDCGGTDTTRAGISFEGTNALNDAFSVNNSNITRCSNGVRISNRASGTVSNSVISINNSTGTSAGVVITTAVSAGGIVDLEGCEVNFNSVGIQPNANNAIRLSAVHMTGNGNALNFNGGTIGTWNNNHIIGNAAGENFAAMTDILEQ